jgi:actin-like ATPase involved in cell morphogenesis
MTQSKNKGEKNREAEIEAASNQTPKQPETSDGRVVGVDIGTSKIVFSEKKNGNIEFDSQRNAFISVDYSKFTEKILNQNKIKYHKIDNSLIVFGDGAEIFANMLNTETRRPMRQGLLNPKESYSVEIIKRILNELVESSGDSSSKINFSIPDPPKGSETDIIYHETVLARHLTEKGYTSRSINEGLAVIFAELEDESFTGLGISAGGGMCNVCLAYLSVPLVSFSINKGGDYIDDATASVTGTINTRVRSIKENGFDLQKKPNNDIEDALHIYYDDLILSLVKALKESIVQTSTALKIDRPVPIVLSGGTAKVRGFKERFEHFLKTEEIPLDFSKIRVAEDPLNATAKGALIAAMNEN